MLLSEQARNIKAKRSFFASGLMMRMKNQEIFRRTLLLNYRNRMIQGVEIAVDENLFVGKVKFPVFERMPF
jgi:hypothetical protein